jgi:serine/threonine protein kinase
MENVREIEKNGIRYILKTAITKEKQVLLQDEIQNLRLINLQNVAGVVKIEDAYISDSGTFLTTKKASGLFGHFNLRNILTSTCELHDLWFREILFQILYTIGSLQLTFLSFRHNDLKADNILLDYDYVNSSSSCKYEWPPPHLANALTSESEIIKIKRSWTLSSRIKTILIDFEVSTSERANEFDAHLNSRSLQNASKKFGLSSNRCDMFDVHLLFAELKMYANYKNWGASFLLFCDSFFDDTMFSSPEFCTSQSRLNLETQKRSMTQRWQNDNFILRLLSHEYFGHLRII